MKGAEDVQRSQNGEHPKRDVRKRYSKEFRADAVKMVAELGLSNEKAAERLGCTTESVRRWVIAHRRGLKPIQLQQELDAAKELRAAKKRMDQLEMENEFLKKAAARDTLQCRDCSFSMPP